MDQDTSCILDFLGVLIFTPQGFAMLMLLLIFLYKEVTMGIYRGKHSLEGKVRKYFKLYVKDLRVLM